jgi:drug/metabolite transporter (DMT)-like permease
MAGLVLAVMGTALVILAGYRARGEKRAYTAGIVLAFLTSLCWAANAFSSAQGSQGLDVNVANTFRMAIALVLCGFSAFMLPIAKGEPWDFTTYRKYLWLFAFEGFAGAFFYLYGFSHAPIAVAAALSSLAPVLSVPIAWATKSEKLSAMKTLGIFIVVAGVWLLVQPN